MMKFVLVLLTAFCLLACGGGSSSGEVSPTTDTPEAETPTDDGSETDDEQGSEGDAQGDDGSPAEQPPSEEVDYLQLHCDDDLSAVILLINTLRAQPQMCGEQEFPAVNELTANALLDKAAEEHAANMANYDFFDHTGLDGSSPGDRISEQGYDWRAYGENIAAGQGNALQAVEGWMNSPGHCRNIMNASVTEMGLACVENRDASYGRYWTQVFASPQ